MSIQTAPKPNETRPSGMTEEERWASLSLSSLTRNASMLESHAATSQNLVFRLVVDRFSNQVSSAHNWLINYGTPSPALIFRLTEACDFLKHYTTSGITNYIDNAEDILDEV